MEQQLKAVYIIILYRFDLYFQLNMEQKLGMLEFLHYHHICLMVGE